jgi:RND family efflux transporter MFP subunit
MRNALFAGCLAGILVFCSLDVSRAKQSMEFDGLIEPYMFIKVGSPVLGVLDKVLVERGDMVKEGQVLAALESEVEKTILEIAKARVEMEESVRVKEVALEYAKRNYERSRDLYGQNVLSSNEWDEVVTKKDLAEHELAEELESKNLASLELKQAAAAVERKTIKSPVTGVVVERYLSRGEYVESEPIVQVAQINPLKVEIILGIEYFGLIKEGMTAEVKPAAPLGGKYTARVKTVDRIVDAASSTFRVTLELPNPKNQITPGFKCSILFNGD